MHESKQKQANSKSQVYSQAREEQETNESFLHQENSLVQHLSGSENLPDASVQAQILSRIPASQIASNPELLLQMQQQFGNSHVSQVVQMARVSSEQGFNGESQAAGVHRKNKTGLPDNLKSGIENLSGYSLNDVKVHYNSDKPAQLHAHAYAQGADIHLASGQEKHLPHEAWHVVQQKQGRVRPTMQFKDGVTVNDEAALEKEADIMGVRASQYLDDHHERKSPVQVRIGQTAPIQCRSGNLCVTTNQHGDSVEEVPDDEEYNLGFSMDISLDIDQAFPYSTLQEHFELTQYVRDQYEFWTADDEIADSQELTDWERDQYGSEDDNGDWESDGSSTSWEDAPGWLDGTTIGAGNLLNTYAVEFYFTIGDDNDGILHTSDEIRLKAESDNEGNVDYSTEEIDDQIDYDPEESDEDSDHD